MPKAAWAPDVRERALAIYLERGPAEASRQTGVPTGTVSQWARRRGVTNTRYLQTTAASQAHVASAEERMTRIAVNLARIADDRTQWIADQPADKDVVRPMTVAAIAIDKAQLLTGKATARVETVEAPERETLGTLLELRQTA